MIIHPLNGPRTKVSKDKALGHQSSVLYVDILLANSFLFCVTTFWYQKSVLSKMVIGSYFGPSKYITSIVFCGNTTESLLRRMRSTIIDETIISLNIHVCNYLIRSNSPVTNIHLCLLTYILLFNRNRISEWDAGVNIMILYNFWKNCGQRWLKILQFFTVTFDQGVKCFTQVWNCMWKNRLVA
jgi:hypothetical protein